MKALKDTTLEQFKWFWNSASRDRILEQYYFDYRKGREWADRIDKAIEYIKYNDSDLYTFEPDYDYEENLVDNYEPSSFREDLLNILQGSEDNE